MPHTIEQKLVVERGDAIGRVVGLAGTDGEHVNDFDDAVTVWVEVEYGPRLGECVGWPMGEVSIIAHTLH